MELPLQDGAVAPKRRFQTSLRSVFRLWARVVDLIATAEHGRVFIGLVLTLRAG